MNAWQQYMRTCKVCQLVMKASHENLLDRMVNDHYFAKHASKEEVETKSVVWQEPL